MARRLYGKYSAFLIAPSVDEAWSMVMELAEGHDGA